MKLLVLAHTPPPFHGQSYMVRILLDCFTTQTQTSSKPGHPSPPAPDRHKDRIQCVHVDFRLSTSVDDIGQRPCAKLTRLLRYAVETVFQRFRRSADTLFYIPAPALPHAIYRDWMIMLVCRPFFRRTVFWWQAAGLGAWLDGQAKPWQRRLTRLLLGRPDLSVVMGKETEHDARILQSRRVVVIPNAIPDPCAQDASHIVRKKAARRQTLRLLLERDSKAPRCEPHFASLRLLYIGLCHREKGLFDAIEAVALINRRLASNQTPVRVQLDVAGRFYLPSEQREFEERIRQPDLQLTEAPNHPANSASASGISAVRYHGFAAGDAKDRLFRECDCLVFPTYYAAESFGLVVLEAMAYGMDVIATRWRNVPELLPVGYTGLVPPRDPQGLADTIQLALQQYHGDQLRHHFELHHHLNHFKLAMAQALLDLERPASGTPAPIPQ